MTYSVHYSCKAQDIHFLEPDDNLHSLKLEEEEDSEEADEMEELKKKQRQIDERVRLRREPETPNRDLSIEH